MNRVVRVAQDDKLLQLSTILPVLPDFISWISALNCVYGKRWVMTGRNIEAALDHGRHPGFVPFRGRKRL